MPEVMYFRLFILTNIWFRIEHLTAFLPFPSKTAKKYLAAVRAGSSNSVMTSGDILLTFLQCKPLSRQTYLYLVKVLYATGGRTVWQKDA